MVPQSIHRKFKKLINTWRCVECRSYYWDIIHFGGNWNNFLTSWGSLTARVTTLPAISYSLHLLQDFGPCIGSVGRVPKIYFQINSNWHNCLENLLPAKLLSDFYELQIIICIYIIICNNQQTMFIRTFSVGDRLYNIYLHSAAPLLRVI